MQPVCSFLARLFDRPHGYSAITNDFQNKKRLQFSIRKILYCNRAHSFYQTQARLIAVSLKAIRRLQKSSLALRHRLTTVLPTSIQLLRRKIYKRFKLLVKSFLNFFANCGFHASYSRIFLLPTHSKNYKMRNATNRNDCGNERKRAGRTENNNHFFSSFQPAVYPYSPAVSVFSPLDRTTFAVVLAGITILYVVTPFSRFQLQKTLPYALW